MKSAPRFKRVETERGQKGGKQKREEGGTENPQHAELMQAPKYRASHNHNDA